MASTAITTLLAATNITGLHEQNVMPHMRTAAEADAARCGRSTATLLPKQPT